MDIYIPKIWIFTISIFFAVVIFVAFVLFYFWHKRRKLRFSPFTERSFRLPGHSLRIERSRISDDLFLHYLYFIFSFVGVPYILFFLESKLRFVFAILMIFCVAFLLRRTWKLFNRLQNISLGREGEEYTGQELNLLMISGAFVFHDIPYKYGNIDHIVVGKDKIFVVETKAVRKPKSKESDSKEYNVVFDGQILNFPHFSTSEPITQARRHANYLSDILGKKCHVDIPVVAVVSLPGWYIQNELKYEDILVINPKRGKALRNWIGELSDKESRNKAVKYLESVARSVDFDSDKTDPDASKKYDFWLNPRVKDTFLGD